MGAEPGKGQHEQPLLWVRTQEMQTWSPQRGAVAPLPSLSLPEH